jgi:hypothetical protein
VGETGTNYRDPADQNGTPKPAVFLMLLSSPPGSTIIFRQYKLPLSEQAQATLKLRVSLSDLMQRFLAVAFGGRGGVGVGSGRYFFFHRDPNLLSAALVVFV